MRIAYFLSEFPAVSQPFVLNQITGMIDRGHEVTIFAPRYTPVEKLHKIILDYRLDKVAVYYHDYPKNHLKRFLLALRLTASSGLWRRPRLVLRTFNLFAHGRDSASLRLLIAAARVFRVVPFDIIHCQFGTLAPLADTLREIGVIQGRLLTSIRGFDVTKHIKNRPGFYSGVFARGDLFLPVSRSMRQRLVDLGCDASRIVILHSGIDLAQFEFRPPRRNDYEVARIVSVGRLVEKKGFEYSIRAVAKLIGDGHKLVYTIIGDGDLRPRIEQLIRHLRVEKQVSLAGWQTHDEVVKAFVGAQLFVAPSVTGSDDDQEGIPNVLKEAMAIGVPVVATRHSGIPELIEHGVSGYLAPEKDVDQLADGMQRILNHHEDTDSMTRRAREKILREFDNDKLNNQLELIYQQVLY